MSIPNQAPDSSVAGFLQPMQPEPAGQIGAGQPLEDFLQQMVAGIAGLDGTLVRPRWQQEPPNLPDYNTTWAGCGITKRRPIGAYSAQIRYPSSTVAVQSPLVDDYGNPIVDSSGNPIMVTTTVATADTYTEMQRHEEFDFQVSFYGPDADVFASNLHDGLMIWQNYSTLRLVGLAFIECQESIRVPELIRQQWWDRVDKDVIFRRIIRRNYPILNLLSASGQIITDTPAGYSRPFSTTALETYWDNQDTDWDAGRTRWDEPS